MVVRALALSLITLLPPTRALHAQDGPAEAALVAFGAGYVALSIGSMARLLGNRTAAYVGDEVRVRGSAVRGRLDQVDADSVTIRADNGDTRFSRRGNAVSVYRGRERKWAQGWGIGLLAGAAVGAVAAHHAAGPDCDWFCPTANQSSALGGIAGGLTGSLVGALIGLGITGERWSPVNGFEAAPRVTLSPERRAVMLGAHLAF